MGKNKDEDFIEPGDLLGMSDEEMMEQPPPPEPEEEEVALKPEPEVDPDLDKDEDDELKFGDEGYVLVEGDEGYVAPTDELKLGDEGYVLKEGDEGYVAPTELKPGDEGYVAPADKKDDESILAADDDKTGDPPKDEKAEKPAKEKPAEKKDEKAEDKSDKGDKSEKKDESAAVDYEAAYKKIMAPFQANGMQLQAKNADDVLQLMQMGANYHKKMVGLKPIMKTVKMLEKHNLMDPEKLAYLVDLHNKDPKAITKLVKDSGIDPLEIDVKVESDYKATPEAVSDTEIEIDEVLDSIKDSPGYERTLNVMSDDWDHASRQAVAQNPNIISLINSQIEDGVYDKIMAAVTYEQTVGNLKGVPFLEAYKQMGDIMDEKGLLYPDQSTDADDKSGDKANPKKAKKEPEKSVADKAKDDQERQARREKASGTRKSGKPAAKKSVNPLDLSDDAFEKMSSDDFKIQT